MIVHEEDYGFVEYKEDVPCVIWTPKGFMKSEQFRELMSIGVDFYGEKKQTCPTLTWLNDTRKMKVLGKEDQNWLEEVVNKQAKENGLKYMAFILPDNIFGKIAVKLYIENTLKKSNSGLKIQTLPNYDKAIAWLKDSVMEPA